MNPYQKNVISVSQLNSFVRLIIESSDVLGDVYVRGEISNFTNHRSGHFYFSVKDENGAVKAVMFRTSAQKLPFLPENGMKVIVHGRISVFERDGVYQLYADDIQPDGVGSLYFAYEQLKAKLSAEGLFDPAHKKPLPKLPMRVGIVTSPTGAAIQDMKNIIGRRFPLCTVVLYPALVQGEGAPASIARGIRYFNEKKSVDLIIIGRGGGSIEDLWAFNNEALARLVYASELPIISAVGHESDFTICDFVADVRASTPSAAAELAVPEATELKQRIGERKERMDFLISSAVAQKRTKLEALEKSKALCSPLNTLDNRRIILSSYLDSLDKSMEIIFGKKTSAYKAGTAALGALNPLAVLSRGYSVAFSDGKLLKSTQNVSVGDRIETRVSDGVIYSTVSETERTENGKK